MKETKNDAVIDASEKSNETEKKSLQLLIQSIYNDKRFKVFLIVFFIFISSAISWRATNSISRVPPLTDSGIFAGGAIHLLEGKVLYKDIWDCKPPMIFFLDAFAMVVGEKSIESIRTMERIFGVFAIIFLYLITYLIFKNNLLSFIATLIYPFYLYNKYVFQWGNLTEEYATTFVLGGILFCLLAKRASNKWVWAYSLTSGLFFSIAVFFKEPFLLSSIPWFFYLILNKEKGVKYALKNGLFFIIGSLIPLLIFLSYFLANNIIKDSIDLLSFDFSYAKTSRVNVSFWTRIINNFKPFYEKVLQNTITIRVFFVLGLFSIFLIPFLKKYKWFPIFAIFSFAAEYLGTMISDRKFGHYYMQLIPSFILVSTCGGALLMYILEKIKVWKICVIILFFFLIIRYDKVAFTNYYESIKMPRVKVKISEISNFIINNSTKEDTIWVCSGHLSKFYLETGRISPTKYYTPFKDFFIDTKYSTADEKVEYLKSSLSSKPPKFIIFSTNYMFVVDTYKISDWVYKNYTKLDIKEGKTELYVLNTAHTDLKLDSKNPPIKIQNAWGY